MHHILVMNGPNLNALGSREPDVYGTLTLDEVRRSLETLGGELGLTVECMQSNHEGVLIDALYEAKGRCAGVLLNPGALTHTSIGIRDAIAAVGLPVVEVHVSNPHARELFRQSSTISGAARGVIQGFGAESYGLALRAMAGILTHGQNA